MTLDEILKQAAEFEAKAQMLPAVQAPTPMPGAHAEKSAKDREVREKVKEIKLMADVIEKKYVALKSVPGFFSGGSIMRDLGKAKVYLEDALKAIEKSS